MPRPRDGVQARLVHGLTAFDAQAESARFLPAERGLHQDEKIPGTAALLEEGFFGVATVCLIGHILGPDVVGFAAVHLDTRNARKQLSFFG